MFELRPFSFFVNKNEFTGSQDGMRYRIAPQEETLQLWVWYDDVCFALSEAGDPESFPLTQEGLDALRERLKEKFDARPNPNDLL